MNGDKINGRTPEEIKKGLECRKRWGTSCNLDCSECDVFIPGMNGTILASDTLAYIQQLEERVVDLNKTSKELERERDAAVEDMTELMQLAQFCRHCKHLTEDGECTFNFAVNKGEPWCWQWRGVQEVE